MNLRQAFNTKLTENGDLAFKKCSENPLINILFMTAYFEKHLDSVPFIGKDDRAVLFARFIRDPRYGLGRRDLGRKLMSITETPTEEIIKSGRVDDVFHIEYQDTNEFSMVLDYLKEQIEKGNELVKKWMPRYSSKNLLLASTIATYWGMNKQQYGHFIKCNTVEHKLSQHLVEEIEFDKLPSLALLKYWKRFQTKDDTKTRFAAYLEDVKAGKKDMKVSTTTVYDIYRNRATVDADLLLSKIEKIAINAIPIIDVSGSMYDANDSIGKALSIGHYLATCSTYAPNQFITFSSRPELVTIVGKTYNEQLKGIAKANWSMNTDFGAVMDRLSLLTELPEYLIVLSDMEFGRGSYQKKTALQSLWKEKGYTTKIVWWNFNSRNTTAPEMDDMGNIFLSGYSPMLLKFLQTSFDAEAFLDKLLDEYRKAIKE